jgi:hypothetical protein
MSLFLLLLVIQRTPRDNESASAEKRALCVRKLRHCTVKDWAWVEGWGSWGCRLCSLLDLNVSRTERISFVEKKQPNLYRNEETFAPSSCVHARIFIQVEWVSKKGLRAHKFQGCGRRQRWRARWWQEAELHGRPRAERPKRFSRWGENKSPMRKQ